MHIMVASLGYFFIQGWKLIGDILGERKFSLYDIEQFIREAGAERVTEDAVLDLEREIEKFADMITKDAKRYAEHAGRKKLIRAEDILLMEKEEEIYSIPVALSEKASNTKNISSTVR